MTVRGPWNKKCEAVVAAYLFTELKLDFVNFFCRHLSNKINKITTMAGVDDIVEQSLVEEDEDTKAEKEKSPKDPKTSKSTR